MFDTKNVSHQNFATCWEKSEQITINIQKFKQVEDLSFKIIGKMTNYVDPGHLAPLGTV